MSTEANNATTTASNDIIDDILTLVEAGTTLEDIVLALKHLDNERRRKREYAVRRYQKTNRPPGRPKKDKVLPDDLKGSMDL
jgi:hypothetical protein